MIGIFEECEIFQLFLPPSIRDYQCTEGAGFRTLRFSLDGERVAYAPKLAEPAALESWLQYLQQSGITRVDYVREPWLQRCHAERFKPLGFLEEYIYPRERFADFKDIYKKRQQARRILDDPQSAIRNFVETDGDAVRQLYDEWQERRGQQLEDFMLANVLSKDWVEKLVLLIDGRMAGFLAYKPHGDTLVMIQNFSRPRLTGANTALLHTAAQRHPHRAFVNYGDCQTGSVLLELDDLVLENLARAKGQLKPSAMLVFRSYRLADPRS